MGNIKPIAIIGHFGGKEHFTDGQTVKTRNLYNELVKRTDWKIKIVDTYFKKKNPVKLFWEMLITFLTVKKVIILLSGNGMRVFFPILYFFSKAKGMEVYHDVIGGNLAQYVIKYPKYRTYLNSFKVNWVETRNLQMELEAQGVKNVKILPNFRSVKLMDESELEINYVAPFKLCTFSRITKQKGIEEAVKAIEKINMENKEELLRIDIYGPVDPEYQEKFDSILKTASTSVRYCGEVPSEEAVSTLRNYYATLFPTQWEGESQAGTISESFIAGVPVIATDWHCNGEMIKTGYNGILYPSKLAVDLVEGIKWMITHKDSFLEIKKNCLKSAVCYLPDEPMRIVISELERG